MSQEEAKELFEEKEEGNAKEAFERGVQKGLAPYKKESRFKSALRKLGAAAVTGTAGAAYGVSKIPGVAAAGYQKVKPGFASMKRRALPGAKPIKKQIRGVMKSFTPPKQKKRKGRSPREMALMRENARLKKQARRARYMAVPPADHVNRGMPDPEMEAMMREIPDVPQEQYLPPMAIQQRPGFWRRTGAGIGQGFRDMSQRIRMRRQAGPKQPGQPAGRITLAQGNSRARGQGFSVVGRTSMLDTQRQANGRPINW